MTTGIALALGVFIGVFLQICSVYLFGGSILSKHDIEEIKRKERVKSQGQVSGLCMENANLKATLKMYLDKARQKGYKL